MRDNNKLPKKWWMQFPKIESRKTIMKPVDKKPDWLPGSYVSIKLKPEKKRMIIKAEWHRHRYEFVYVIETSAINFEPYWFSAQLEFIDDL